MAETRIDCDVAVIGGGIAGMTAALRVAESGLKVRLFEKSGEDRYMCSTRISGGIFHCAQTDILTSAAELEAKILDVTSGTANPELAKAVAADGIRGVRWLQGHGIRFIKGAESYHSFILSPPVIMANTRQWEGRGGDVLLRTLEASLVKQGGIVHRGHAVQRLSRDGAGPCTGLSGFAAAGAFEVSARNVVVADGGFQMDTARLQGAVSPAPEKLFQRNARSGCGDGLRMATAVGAAVTDLHGFYGHVLSRSAFTNDQLWPYRWLDFVAAAGMAVDGAGRRFCDEGLGGVHIANSIAALPDPLSVTVIADRTIWEERGRYNMLPPNPVLKEAGGTVHEAGTIAELAAKAGISPEGLEQQIRLYNQAVEKNSTGALAPQRSTHKFQPYRIQNAPFYAFPVCAGITYTMGGLRIDGNARVIDVDGRAIAGLYAAGAATGGVEGGPRHGYVGGLIKSLVTGLRAGEAIAAVAVKS